MLTLSLVATLLLGSARASDDPCAGVKLQTDGFTHATTAKVQQLFYWTTWYTLWKAEFNGGVSQLTLNVPMDGMQLVVFAAGYSAQFLMADGSIVSLQTTADAPPVPQSSGTSVMTTWNLVFPLSKEQVAAFSGQAVTSVRTPLPNGDRTWTVKSKSQKTFQKAFACYASMTP
jgi:hypothetical protein